MGILDCFLFLFLLTFSIIHSENVCSYSFCGNIQIDHPFKLQGQEPRSNFSYIDLTCSDQGIPALNLPSSGDFYVRYIEYYTQRIALYDPYNCLPRRLMMNFINLSSSPFMSTYYENYTFYTCPVNSYPAGYDVIPIGCLSNSTNVTVSTSGVAADLFAYYGCTKICSWLIPVMHYGQFEYNGIYSNLILTWDVHVSDCKDCDQQPAPQETGGSRWHQLIRSPFFLPCSVLLVFFFLSCCVRLMKMKVENAEGNANADHNSTTAAALPTVPTIVVPLPSAPAPAEPSSTAGLDDSKIKSYTELVVLGENQSILGHGNSSCAICLETYNSKEKVRSIAKCGHFFHADCIYLWLRNNRTCPVCRTLV